MQTIVPKWALLSVLIIALCPSLSEARVPNEVLGILSEYPLGMKREEVAAKMSRQQEATIENDKGSFNLYYRARGDGNGTIVARVKVRLNFTGGVLVWKDWLWEMAKGSPKDYQEYWVALQEIVSKSLGEAKIRAVSETVNNDKLLHTMWSAGDAVLDMYLREQAGEVFVKHYFMPIRYNDDTVTSIKISHLRFGAVADQGGQASNHLQETRTINKIGSAPHGLEFDIESPEPVAVQLRITFPKAIEEATSSGTSKPPLVDGKTALLDHGKQSIHFAVDFTLEPSDPIGQYLIEVLIDGRLQAMVGYSVADK